MRNYMNLVKKLSTLLSILCPFVVFSSPMDLTYFTKASEIQTSLGHYAANKNYSENGIKRKGEINRTNYSIGYGFKDNISLAYSSSVLWIDREFNERTDFGRNEEISKGLSNGYSQITYRLMANNPFVIDLYAGYSMPYGMIKIPSGADHGSAYTTKATILGWRMGGTIYELEWLASIAARYNISSKQLDQNLGESFKMDSSMDLSVDLAMQYNYSSGIAFFGDVAIDVITEKNGISLSGSGRREKEESFSRNLVVLGIKYLFWDQLFGTFGIRYSKESDYTVNRVNALKRENNEELGVVGSLTFTL